MSESSSVVVGGFGGTPYRELANLHAELLGVINEREGRVSLSEVIGVLEIIKMELWTGASDEAD